MDTEEADIAQLCAQNIVLWQHFLEAFSGREAVHQHLARVHHQLRVKGDLQNIKITTIKNIRIKIKYRQKHFLNLNFRFNKTCFL